MAVMDREIAEADRSGFEDEAFDAFIEIIASSGKDVLEDIQGVNKGEMFVLQYLLTHGGDVIPTEMRAALRSSTSRVSALLSALEKKGQISRDTDRSNRRNVLVQITEAGRRRAETEMKVKKTTLTQTFADMGEADTQVFLRLISRFFDLMQEQFERSCEEKD